MCIFGGYFVAEGGESRLLHIMREEEMNKKEYDI